VTLFQSILLLGAALVGAIFLAAAVALRRRNVHLWLMSFVRQEVRRRTRPKPSPSEPIHVLLCIADHFEPHWGGGGGASAQTADERVAAWVRDYPARLGGFRDSDGRPPRHTFFYPIDQYNERHVDAIAGLCRAGFGDLEIHLHHDGDTAENLHATLRRWSQLLAERHGLLGRWPDGHVAYGFVHGNWALDNSRPDGRWCGVDNELDVLRRTGCYADFTYPSAPDPTQTATINSIYYATGCPHRRKSHDRGTLVGAAPPPRDSLMLVQGPLRLWWPRSRWTPAIENGCLQRGQEPSMERLEQWIRAGVRVPSRPDWIFVKLHTHGAVEANRRMLLGDPMLRFHKNVADRAVTDNNFKFHYVTAREMYNLAKAAEAGFRGPVSRALNHIVVPWGPDNEIPGSFSESSNSAAHAGNSCR
jgi:hypothetical protein